MKLYELIAMQAPNEFIIKLQQVLFPTIYISLLCIVAYSTTLNIKNKMKRKRQNQPLEKISKNISLTYYMNIFKQVRKKKG